MYADAAPQGPVGKSFATVPASPPSAIAGRYGERRGINVSAVAAVLLLHAVAIGALLHMRSEHGKVTRHALTVVDLTPPPAPPSAAEKPPPPQPPSRVTIPAPALEIPRTQPVPIAIVDPLPASPQIVAAPPAPPAPPAQPSVVQAKDLGTRMLSAVPPRYPAECRRRREQGTVVLSLVLDVEGRVASISVAESSGHSRLDEAALRAVRKWRWAPTMRDGNPVMVRGVVEIPFVLQG